MNRLPAFATRRLPAALRRRPFGFAAAADAAIFAAACAALRAA